MGYSRWGRKRVMTQQLNNNSYHQSPLFLVTKLKP